MPVNHVRKYLKNYDEKLEPIEFEESTSTVEEAARTLGVQPAQIAKSILFRAGENYALFVTAGDVRVNQKKAKALLGGKAKLASREEVENITGYKVGGVCPFALKVNVPIYLDKSMERFDVVYTAAGTANSALPISLDKLQEITGGTIVDVQAG
ncbi:MAG: YbaK/EbsC family protein [Desulfotomaculum sp.]|nr:YbaK/EbsC family protein [Desulfotomaculum sp.]